MEGYIKTLNLILLLKEDSLSQARLKDSVLLSSKIAVKYLRSFHAKDLDRLLCVGFTIEDIAFDAITPLFVRKSNPNDLPIRQAILKWTEPITSEEDALFFLSQIIGNRVEQELSKKYKELDPFFGKILRSVNYVIEKKGYAKTTYFGVVHLVENDSVSITQLPPEPDFIESLSGNFIYNSTEKTIDSVFKHLKEETNYFPAIPLNALIKRIKEFHSQEFRIQFPSDEKGLDESLDIETITNNCLDETLLSLHNTYIVKGKISPEDSKYFREALTKYAYDLKDGGVSRGLYEYFNNENFTITRDDFYKKYYNAFDYLIRLLKRTIVEKIERQ
jgi:hypothetical protein